MTSNKLVKQEDIIAVKEVLKKFQEGYTNRNVEVLDTYMKELFIDDNSITTLGTSRSELCFGLEDLKGLIESDWKYWGNFVVDFENSKINSNGNSAWFIADSTVNWADPDDDDEWCEDLVDDYYEEKGRYTNYKPIAKLAMLNRKLAFIVQETHTSKGSSFPVRLSGGLIKENDQWLINKLQFSMPMPSYPEWRADNDNADTLKYYNEMKEKMAKSNDKPHDESRASVIETLKELQMNYLNKDADVNDTVQNLFLAHDDIYLVDPNENPAAFGKESIETMIVQQRDKWDEMTLNVDESIISAEGDTATIVTNGLFKKTLTSDEFLENEWQKVKETLQKEGKGADKLFEAQKHIAYAFKEFAFGEASTWEFRFEALAVKENDKWRFHNVQFTYPSLYMFDGDFSKTTLL